MKNFRSTLTRFRKAEEGQAVVLIAIASTMLLMMAALGVDVGYLEYQHQQMQKAADAGAVAGAAALTYGSSDANITNAAKHDTAANGFPDGGNVTVTVNHPPASGPYAHDSHYVEVIVAEPRPTFFMKVGGHASANVSARAVASVLGNSGGCIYVMDPTDSATYTDSGAGNLNATCGLKVRSSSSSAFVDSGGACTTVTTIGIVGGVGQDACSTPAQGSGAFSTGIRTFNDPLAYLTAPVTSPVSCPVAGQPPVYDHNACTYSNNNGLKCNSSPALEILPGTYCGGITISGNGVTATFKGGNYILAGGGLTVSGGANVLSDASGGGVMFYNTYNAGDNPQYKPIVISGGSGTDLVSPSSGNYEGILFFQDRTIPSKYTGASGPQNTVSGGSGGIFDGGLYFISTPLVFSGGSSSGNNNVTIVSYTLTISGPSYIQSNYTGDGQNPVHVAVLAE